MEIHDFCHNLKNSLPLILAIITLKTYKYIDYEYISH